MPPGSRTTGFPDSIAPLRRPLSRPSCQHTKEGDDDDCALVLIDYQKEMFEVVRSETSADLVEMHVRLLAKSAKAFAVPIVLSTVGVGAGFNGPTVPSILAELEGIEPIDRTSMNAFEDKAFSDAVKVTGRKRL